MKVMNHAALGRQFLLLCQTEQRLDVALGDAAAQSSDIDARLMITTVDVTSALRHEDLLNFGIRLFFRRHDCPVHRLARRRAVRDHAFDHPERRFLPHSDNVDAVAGHQANEDDDF